MRRDQLEHAVRTACQIIDRGEVIVVGSQAILGTYDEDALPLEATMSVEIDILPIATSHAETTLLADLSEGVAGEFSSGDGDPARGLARPPRQGSERQHRGAFGRTTVRRLVSRQGRPLRGQTLRLPGEGSRLRRGPARCRARRR